MKIVFCISSLSTGGAERVAATLAEAWVQAGHEVVLVTTFAQPAKPELSVAAAITLHSLADDLAHRPAMLRAWPFRVGALANLLNREKPDIVCSFLTNVNAAAVLASRLAGYPIVVSERTFPPAHDVGTIFNTLRRLLYPLSDRVVMQTAEGLGWLEEAIPRARGLVLANPVRLPLPTHEPALRPEDVVNPGRKVLLAAGRFSPEKGFSQLIRAFARAADRQPEWDLVILGDGPLLEKLRNEVARLALEARIKLPGRAGNLQAWLDYAHAFALSSTFEGYPNALLEAVASGLPAVAVDCATGPRELVRDGHSGVLLPRGADEADLAGGIERLLSSHWQETESAARALRAAHAPTTIAGRWIELFREVIKSHVDDQG